jgi:hypothetical protein
MRVHGVDGLRVVDAASMRYITNGNIYAPIMMLAEKSADLVLGNTPLTPEPVDFFRRDACAVVAVGGRVGERADALDDRIERGLRSRGVRVERFAHRAQVLGRRAAAPADDRGAGVGRQVGVLGHERGRTRVDDLGAAEFGDAAVAFRDEAAVAVGARHREQRHQDVGRADAAVRADRDRSGIQTRERGGQLGGVHAHHRAGPRCRTTR